MGHVMQAEKSKHELFVEKRKESFIIGDKSDSAEFFNEDIDELIELLIQLKEIQ